MVDFDSITGLAASIKAVAELAKIAIDARDEEKQRQAVADLQSAIIAAQGQAIEAQSMAVQMREELTATKTRLTELEATNRELNRYELKDFGDGTLAYRLKPEFANAQPEHFLCLGCFDKKIKSTLRFDHTTSIKQRKYTCTNCGNEYYLGESFRNLPQSANLKPRTVV